MIRNPLAISGILLFAFSTSLFAATSAVSVTNPPAGPGAGLPTGPVMVTESFAAAGTFSSNGGGDLNTASITRTLHFTGTCLSLSVDVTLTTAANELFEDNNALDRGFGAWDGSGGDRAINTAAEVLTFSMGAPVITYNSGADYITSVSGNLDFGFTSFDLVNNGNSAPSANWTTTNGAGSGTVTSPMGGAGLITNSGSFPALGKV